MDTDTLKQTAFESVRVTWARFATMYTLNKPCPTVVLNNRLKTTAGRCDLMGRVIDLSTSLFSENPNEFERVIIPHETAHMVAWDLFGDAGHGTAWKGVMVKFGLPPDRCHNLVSAEYHATRMHKKMLVMSEAFNIGDSCAFEHTNRQHVVTTISGIVIRVNEKTITMKDKVTLKEWRVPYNNNCNLRHV